MLDGIPQAPRGVPQIEVSFDIDANGILNVSAKDKATGKSQSIRIEGSAGLSKEEVERMKKDAELHVKEDKKKQDLIEARNLADQMIYTSEKTLNDAKDKISEEVKKPTVEKIDALKKIKGSDNMEEIKQKTQELSQEMQKIGQELYKQNPQDNKGTNPPPHKASEDKEADEGEFKEKK